MPELSAQMLLEATTSLSGLVEAYLTTQVKGQSKGTEDHKRNDLRCFLDFYRARNGHERPEGWYASVTREFLSHISGGGGRMPASFPSRALVYRRYATIRHFARWADRTLNPFPFGCPTDGVKGPEAAAREWLGLSEAAVARLRTAASVLRRRPRPGTNTGLRDYAFLEVLIGTGLRLSEVAGLSFGQWDEDRGCFRSVVQKGGYLRPYVQFVGGRNDKGRRIFHEWCMVRTPKPGPLFPTRTWQHLDRRQCTHIIWRIVDEANVDAVGPERLVLTAHDLRHTCLRRIAREMGEAFALEQSGHRSPRYISRYVKPSPEEMRERLTGAPHSQGRP